MRFKVKIRPSDKLWTEYIRLRDNNICCKCGKVIESKYNSGVSHFHNRTKESTRYDDENCDLMCNIPCHQEWEHEKKEGRDYYNFKLNQLGQKRFDLLTLRANTTGKRDDKLNKIIIQEKIKEIERTN
jgi:5-methylcytosine-specific restriction endonuclease McrA